MPEFAVTESKYRSMCQVLLFSHLIPVRYLLGLPLQIRHVVLANCVLFISAQVRKFVHSVARPLPAKSCDFAGHPMSAVEKFPSKKILRFFKNSSDLHPSFLLLMRGQIATAKGVEPPCRTRPITHPSGNV